MAKTIVAEAAVSACETFGLHDASACDEIDERFLNARDERIQALTLAMLHGLGARISAGEALGEIKAMLSRASREAFDLLVAESMAL